MCKNTKNNDFQSLQLIKNIQENRYIYFLYCSKTLSIIELIFKNL